MSQTTQIHNLPPPILLNIFNTYLNHFNLQYSKIDKQISYKCYEITWILNQNKATGYGQNMEQADQNGLKNLIEILLEDPRYKQYLTTIISNTQRPKTIQQPITIIPIPPSPTNSPSPHINPPHHKQNKSNIHQNQDLLPNLQIPLRKLTTILQNQQQTIKSQEHLNCNKEISSNHLLLNKSYNNLSNHLSNPHHISNKYYPNTKSSNKIQKYENLSHQNHSHQLHTLSHHKIHSKPHNTLLKTTNYLDNKPQSNSTLKKINSTIIQTTTSINPRQQLTITAASNKKNPLLSLNKQLTSEPSISKTSLHPPQHRFPVQPTYNRSNSRQKTSQKHIPSLNQKLANNQQLKQAIKKTKKLQEQYSLINKQNIKLMEQIELLLSKIKDSKKMEQNKCHETRDVNKDKEKKYNDHHQQLNHNNTKNQCHSVHIQKTQNKQPTKPPSLILPQLIPTSIPIPQSTHTISPKYPPQPTQTPHSPIHFPSQLYKTGINKHTNKNKIPVPKLKLQILNNCQLNNQKSLNDTLLNIYQQKYGHVRYGSNKYQGQLGCGEKKDNCSNYWQIKKKEQDA